MSPGWLELSWELQSASTGWWKWEIARHTEEFQPPWVIMHFKAVLIALGNAWILIQPNDKTNKSDKCRPALLSTDVNTQIFCTNASAFRLSGSWLPYFPALFVLLNSLCQLISSLAAHLSRKYPVPSLICTSCHSQEVHLSLSRSRRQRRVIRLRQRGAGESGRNKTEKAKETS